MNRSGVTFLVTLMLGVVVMILALAFAPVVNEFNDDSRNTTTRDGAAGLDCTNSSISDFDNAACVGSDITTAAFVGILLAVGLAIIVGRIIFA